MTINEVEMKLTAKYPQFLKEPDELKDIGAFLGRFSGEDIQAIWNQFRLTYKYGTLPRLAIFNDAAKEVNVGFQVYTGRRYDYVCYVCASKSEEYFFPLEYLKCPRCGNSFRPWISVAERGFKLEPKIAQTVMSKCQPGPDAKFGRKEFKK